MYATSISPALAGETFALLTELLSRQDAGLRKLMNQSRLRDIAAACFAAGIGRACRHRHSRCDRGKGTMCWCLDVASGLNSAALLLNGEPRSAGRLAECCRMKCVIAGYAAPGWSAHAALGALPGAHYAGCT